MDFICKIKPQCSKGLHDSSKFNSQQALLQVNPIQFPNQSRKTSHNDFVTFLLIKYEEMQFSLKLFFNFGKMIKCIKSGKLLLKSIVPVVSTLKKKGRMNSEVENLDSILYNLMWES